jgi:ArsR family transcriptional regulator
MKTMTTALDGLCCGTLRTTTLTDEAAEELASVLKALADPVRLRIVALVASAAEGELCSCELPALLDRSQPTVSHHLALLVAAGVLEREQRGKWAWYRMRPPRLAAIASLLDGCC